MATMVDLELVARAAAANPFSEARARMDRELAGGEAPTRTQAAAIRMKAKKNSTAPSTGNHIGVGDSSGAKVSSAGSS